MFEKNDKHRLYWLIDMYLTGEMSADHFCDEFYYCYDLELNNYQISENESRLFKKLSVVADRFSSSKDDHEKYPCVYYTEEDLRKKIIETKETLKYEAPMYQLLIELIDKSPKIDVKKISDLIDKFDWPLAFETLCIQIYQNKIPISSIFFEKMQDFGNKMNVDPFICWILKDLIIK